MYFRSKILIKKKKFFKHSKFSPFPTENIDCPDNFNVIDKFNFHVEKNPRQIELFHVKSQYDTLSAPIIFLNYLFYSPLVLSCTLQIISI